MALALNNAQGELNALEIGWHALGFVENGGTARDYAKQMQVPDDPSGYGESRACSYACVCNDMMDTAPHPDDVDALFGVALPIFQMDAGAETCDLDALQYHPNGGAWPSTMQGYSIPETTRAYGAVLLNADGEEFTDSLGARDAVSQAIFDEVEAGRGIVTEDGRPAVWLDTTRIAPEDAEISLPYMLRRYRGAGIDPLAEKITTYPVLHYQNGGLVIDDRAETTLEGVFACGEIAGGTHGRNRMMGNSLLECVVFGRRAGKAAAERART